MKNWWKIVGGWMEQEPTRLSEHAGKMFDRMPLIAAAVGAIAAYVYQPLLPFADYGELSLAGTFLAMTAILTLILRERRPPVFFVTVVGFLFFFSVGKIMMVGAQAGNRSDIADLRCAKIQAAMFDPGPHTRADLPDLFSALGCRQQIDRPHRRPIHWRSAGSPEEYAELYRKREAEERRFVAMVKVETNGDGKAMVGGRDSIQRTEIAAPSSAFKNGLSVVTPAQVIRSNEVRVAR